MSVKKRIEVSHLRAIVRKAVLAARKDGREVLGLIVDNGFCLELVECRNKAREGGSFCFYANEVRAIVKGAERVCHEVVGTFHSHPVSPAIPGEADLDSAVDDSLMLIIDCTRRKSRLWHIRDKRVRELRLSEFRL